MINEIKMKAGGKLVKVKNWQDDKYEYFKFGFNRPLLEEIKCLEGARWEPEKKHWYVKRSQHNDFQLEYLKGNDPYAWWDQPLVTYTSSRTPYNHQMVMTRSILTYHYVILAAEMGTGKTLAAIEAMEHSGIKDVLYVAPASALAAVDLELRKWKSSVIPHMVTYDGLKNLVTHWPTGFPAPRMVIYDESSRCKNPTTQRSIAAAHLADSVRREHGKNGYVILMSGSPAPKSPADWWWQCEMTQPGFIKEGSYQKFKNRLGLIVEKESLITGGVYPHLITWKDNEKKCAKCGELKEHANHNLAEMAFVESSADFHGFEPSTNEVSKLYQRMKGLTVVFFKKDCIDLPDKQYRIVHCKPSSDTLRAAKIVASSSPSTIAGLTLLRELSDGFQYQQEQCGWQKCERCDGKGTRMEFEFTGRGMEDNEQATAIWESDELTPEEKQNRLMEMGLGFDEAESSCRACEGAGEVPVMARKTVPVKCPKEDALIEIMDSHSEDDDGRLVVYAGFTGSIDRIQRLCTEQKWEWIRVDGTGAKCSFGERKLVNMLEAFQDHTKKIAKILFLAHPGSGGMGVTLTESSEIVYYSNDFNAESKIQSEDRIHRIGMDVNRGALITELVHLPTDMKIIENLRAKRRLQDLSLGSFYDSIREYENQGRVA